MNDHLKAEHPNMPEGSTHYHQGDNVWRPHYLKIDDGKIFTWITGYVGGDCWSDSAAHAEIEEYESI